MNHICLLFFFFLQIKIVLGIQIYFNYILNTPNYMNFSCLFVGE